MANETDTGVLDFIEIDDDFIEEVQAGARTKGAGEEVLTNFLNSGMRGVEVNLKAGPFAGKTGAQAYTSLNNAKKKTKEEGDKTVLVNPDAKQVQVVKRKIEGVDHVYLVNKSIAPAEKK